MSDTDAADEPPGQDAPAPDAGRAETSADAASAADADPVAASGAAAPVASGSGEPAPAGTEPAQPMARRVRRGVLAMVVGLAIYYAVPVGTSPSTTAVVLSVLGILAGMAILVWLVYRQVQRLVRSRPGDTSVRLEGLVLVVYLIVPMFSLGYFTLADADPSQFDDLETKTDSLYFTVSTLATVGFGDVHAAGQLARVLVTIQMVFDLVFVAAVASLLSTQIRERAAQRRQVQNQ